MTLKVLIVNTPDNPTDKIIEVEHVGVTNPGKRNLFAGMSMDGLVYEGSEYHIREAAIPPPEPPEETKPQHD